MSKLLLSPVFIVSVVLFCIHQILQKVMHIQIPYVDNYLDNILAMPIILTLLLAERQYLFKKGANYQLSVLTIIITTIYISLITELLFPLLSQNFHSDWLDVLCYSTGSLLFHFTINKSIVDPDDTFRL